MAYYGKILSNELLLHAIRTTPSLKDGLGKPLTEVTLRMRPDGSYRHNGEYLRWRRRKMYEIDPLCHWCRKLMVLVERPGVGNARIKANEATIDHLDERYSRERGRHPGKIRQVLACSACNSGRDRAKLKALPLQTRWEMSWANFLDIAKRSGALNEVTE